MVSREVKSEKKGNNLNALYYGFRDCAKFSCLTNNKNKVIHKVKQRKIICFFTNKKKGIPGENKY